MLTWMCLAPVTAVTAACGDATGSSPTTGSAETTDPRTKPSPSNPASAPASVSPSANLSVPGEAAVWFLRPDQNLQASSTRFVALVSRLGCNSGVTGQVLAPDVRLGPAEVVVTFFVAPRQKAAGTCQANNEVPYEVDLGEPLRGRKLVDGQCLPGGQAVTSSSCLHDSIRFRP